MTTESVIVIGAGIVGTATARALQRSGHAVTLVDSAEPGKATSYGNAGFIAIDHVLPLARPSTLKRVPQMLMDRNGPLTVHPPKDGSPAMSQNLNLAQENAFNLARTLMVPVVLFQVDDAFGVMVSSEYDGEEDTIVHDYDPFEIMES